MEMDFSGYNPKHLPGSLIELIGTYVWVDMHKNSLFPGTVEPEKALKINIPLHWKDSVYSKILYRWSDSQIIILLRQIIKPIQIHDDRCR